MKKLFSLGLIVCLFSPIRAQQVNPLLVQNELTEQKKWVDSIYDSMSLEERVGQLFMVDVFSSDPKSKINKVKDLIRDQFIGGVIFSKGGPLRQAKLNNEFQSISKVPLLHHFSGKFLKRC